MMTAFSIHFDERGEILGVTKDGEEAHLCEVPPEGKPKAIKQYGSDPGNGEGVEFLQYSENMICVHWFCHVYCW